MEDSQLGDTGGPCTQQHPRVNNHHSIEPFWKLPIENRNCNWQENIPDPNNLARFDSFSRPAAIGGDIVTAFFLGCLNKTKTKKKRGATNSLELAAPKRNNRHRTAGREREREGTEKEFSCCYRKQSNESSQISVVRLIIGRPGALSEKKFWNPPIPGPTAGKDPWFWAGSWRKLIAYRVLARLGTVWGPSWRQGSLSLRAWRTSSCRW